jgi:DNA-binding IclR family transcriptional regulator
MVLGAQSPESALSSEDLAAKLGADVSHVEEEMKLLVEAGYAETVSQSGTWKIYLTGTGIITASSTYS